MKKILFTIFTLAILLSMSNCDVGLGDNDEILENKFTGGTWEQIFKNNDNEIFQSNKITFTDNNFIFNTWLKNNYDKTYTGNYTISFISNNYYMMKTTSADPIMNGIIYYSFLNNDPNAVFFMSDDNNLPLGGTYKKTTF